METVRTALVTGASSGIGEATAERLAEAGYKVYGTSRRGGQAGQRPFEMLAARRDQRRIGRSRRSRGDATRQGRIDLLVNNAGFGVAPGAAEESSIDQARAIFDTNFFGVVRMTRAVVPHMRRQGAGRIINIGSVLGFLPMPYGALYAATKHAIEGYSESLDHELRTRGIRVSVIEPAYTKTPFDANLLEPDEKLDEYREVRAAVGKTVKEVMAAAEPPSVVAEVVLKAANAARPKLRYTAGESRGPAAFPSHVCAGGPARRGHSKRPPPRRDAEAEGLHPRALRQEVPRWPWERCPSRSCATTTCWSRSTPPAVNLLDSKIRDGEFKLILPVPLPARARP